jgi:hypothetical protein
MATAFDALKPQGFRWQDRRGNPLGRAEWSRPLLRLKPTPSDHMACRPLPRWCRMRGALSRPIRTGRGRRPVTRLHTRSDFVRKNRLPQFSLSAQFFDGGRTRARTLDPLIKSQLLYQLSYAPIEVVGSRGSPAKSAAFSKGAKASPAETAIATGLSSSPCPPACSCRSTASSRAAFRRSPRSDARWRARASP